MKAHTHVLEERGLSCSSPPPRYIRSEVRSPTYLDDDEVLMQRPPRLVVGVVLREALYHALELRDQCHAVLLGHLKVVGDGSTGSEDI